eukprot:scaffold394604_cov34-Prasinocladus_malaysianus.AAC.1
MYSYVEIGGLDNVRLWSAMPEAVDSVVGTLPEERAADVEVGVAVDLMSTMGVGIDAAVNFSSCLKARALLGSASSPETRRSLA